MTAGSDRTLFAALQGALAPHPWRGAEPDSDAYSLFHARSSALGWLTEAREGAMGGLWGMNDAGSGREPARAAWFQVVLTGPVPPGRPLPTQAFLACAGDVVARIGILRLDALQVLMPLRRQGPPAVSALLADAAWFADRAPGASTRVRVTLDSGQEPALSSAAPAMAEWIGQWAQDVFRCDGCTPTDHPDVEPAGIDHLWNGPSRHRATLTGALAEWSLDALGWLAAFLADAAAVHGVHGPVLLSATRGGP